jgi:PmbA protein
VGRRQASVSGSDISAEARAKLVERGGGHGALAPEDPYAGLADPDRLARARCQTWTCSNPAEPSAEALEERARTAEAAARSGAEGDQFRRRQRLLASSRWTMVSSGGFSGVHRASGFSIGASASPATRGHGDRLRRPLHPLGGRPAGAGSLGAEAGRRAAGGWARARSPRPPPR